MSHNDEPIKMFLELSKGVPLSIIPGTQVLENELQPEIFALLIPESSRIRSLSLCLPTTLHQDLTSKVWDAPLLESVNLYPGPQGMPHDRAIAFIQDATLPTLRSLSLATFSYTAAHDIPRSTLTTLVIRHPVAELRVAEWVDVLDALPLLEHLVLVHAMKANTNDEPVSRPVARSVTMARLAHVELRDRVAGARCPCLLDHLALPACRRLALRGETDDAETAEEYHEFFSAAASALGDRFVPRSCLLRLNWAAVTVCLWQDTPPAFKHDRGPEDSEPAEYPQVTVEIGGIPLRSDILSVLVPALPLSDVRTLRLWLEYMFDHNMRPLSPLRRVESFLYRCECPAELLEALSESQHGTPLLFPTLRYLTLRDTWWLPNSKWGEEPHSVPSLGERIDNMLLARGEMGAPLHQLHLQGLHNADEPKDRDRLETGHEGVSHFEWDAKDRGDEDWLRYLIGRA